MKQKHLVALVSFLYIICPETGHAGQPVLANPILFVTQVPIVSDFTTIASAFGNHLGDIGSCGRGGDLWIRYPDGTLKNLTQAAGYGRSGFQSSTGISVREPSVYWNGNKALFSMVIGGTASQFSLVTNYWQIYEITNFLDPAATPIITKIPHQPTNYNNVSPFYGTDDKILFTSDRPRNGDPALYPQRDEYEEAATITGIWSLDPVSGILNLLNHTPSGAFSPSIDSFGRIIFSRWDHLQRDQQADGDNVEDGQNAGTFNYSDETANALILTNDRTEIYPEPRYATNNTRAFTFNQFFPWQINEDGTAEETINHVGRHELKGSYVAGSLTDDPNVQDLYDFAAPHYNTNVINNILEMTESPVTPGLFYGVDVPEFGSHGGGQLVTLIGSTNVNPDFMTIQYLTPRSTSEVTNGADILPTDDTGLYRNPVPMSDGTLVCVHTAVTGSDVNLGSDTNPVSTYDFRLKTLRLTNGFFVPDQLLTPGISKTVSWWSPDQMITYSNTLLWELDPVEVRARTRPARRVETIDVPEQLVFDAEKVNVGDLQNYLRAHNLALIISRNVTTRDHADQQQPFNLHVPNGVQTIGKTGKIYDVQFLQLMQADQIRGTGFYNSNSIPRPGRRVLAQYLHEPLVDNPPLSPAAPTGSVQLGTDGSMAAFVPARRAITWHLVDAATNSVVKERYWLTFQPGEIRTCANCHGVNEHDQSGAPVVTNSPMALRDLLRYWKSTYVPAPQIQASGGAKYLSVTFGRRLAATNITYTVQVSSNLTTWLSGSTYSSVATNANTAVTTQVSCTGTNTQTIVVRDNTLLGPGINRYIRVQTTAN